MTRVASLSLYTSSMFRTLLHLPVFHVFPNQVAAFTAVTVTSLRPRWHGNCNFNDFKGIIMRAREARRNKARR